MLRRLLFALIAVPLACKKEPSATTSAPAPSPSASAPVKKLAKVALPPITAPADKELTLGDKKTHLVVCKLDVSAPTISDKDWWHHTVTSMAVAPDGSLYVVDHEQKIRHYVNQSEKGCELALEGVRDFQSSRGSFINAAWVDNKGTVYFDWHKKPQRIRGNEVDEWCSDYIRADAWSPLVIADGNVTHGEGCSGKYAKGLLKGFDPSVPQYDQPKVVGLFGEELVSEGVDLEKGKSIHKVGVHGLDGTRRLVLGGHDEEMLWSIKHATACDGDLCVLDAPISRSSVFRWTRDGKFVGKLSLSDAELSISAVHIGWTKAGLYVGGAVRGEKDWIGVIALLPGL